MKRSREEVALTFLTLPNLPTLLLGLNRLRDLLRKRDLDKRA